MRKMLTKFIIRGILLFVVASVAGTLLYRFTPVWVTPYMIAEKIRAIGRGEDSKIHKKWVSYEQISEPMKGAVVAAEDQKFFEHAGFDFEEIRKVLQSKKKRGASTITQQVAKNVFLWHGRSYLRKGLEAWFTVLIELIWPKERILEVYLNVAETGPLTFGVEAAAQRYYKVSASQLTRTQASTIAAILPNPKVYRVVKPGPYVQKRSAWIRRQMRNLGY